MKQLVLVVLTVFALVNNLQSQDTLVLKNKDTILVNILEMDNSNVYFLKIDDSSKTIFSFNWSKIESARIFENDYVTNKNDIETVANKDTLSSFNKKPFGLSIDLLPSIGGSINFDITEDVNISLGAGLLYFNFGGKFYVKNYSNKKRLFIGLNIYNLQVLNILSKNYFNIETGYEYRSQNGINFIFKGGIFKSSSILFPMIGFEFGYRF